MLNDRKLGRVPCDDDWKNPVRSGRKQRYSQWLCAVGCLAFFVPFFLTNSGLLKIVNGFRLPPNEKVHK
jgi:hypothetical protein